MEISQPGSHWDYQQSHRSIHPSRQTERVGGIEDSLWNFVVLSEFNYIGYFPKGSKIKN